MTDDLLDIPPFLRRPPEPAAAIRRPRPQAWKMPARRPPRRKRPGQVGELLELGYSRAQVAHISRADADMITSLKISSASWFND